MDAKIIKLEPEQWKAYRTLRFRALTQDPISFAPTLEEVQDDKPKEWRERLANYQKGEEATMWFVFNGKKVVGMAGAYREHYKKLQHIWVIHSAYLDSAYRGRGLGKALLEKLIAELKTKPGVHKITLESTELEKGNIEANPAYQLYLKLGFEPSGILRDETFYDGKYYTIHLMEMLLD